VVFDFDDAIYIRDDNASDPFSRTRISRFIRIIKAADKVIAGNPILAEFAGNFCTRPAEVLPSAVPAKGIPTKDWHKKNPRPVIGWVGGGGNLHHLTIIKSALQRLACKFDFELRVISDVPFSIENVRVVNIPWQLATQEQEIANFDIGIMPIPQNRWTAGKCSYKLLQYMAAGIPVVATDWGFNSHVVTNGESGYLASDDQGFFLCLDRLLNSPEKARRMADNGQKIAVTNFSIEAIALRLFHILYEL
jgi:glycosyltransferase involved in cell wall biosynthesis